MSRRGRPTGTQILTLDTDLGSLDPHVAVEDHGQAADHHVVDTRLTETVEQRLGVQLRRAHRVRW